jgi:SAM-dependent methyltransferase
MNADAARAGGALGGGGSKPDGYAAVPDREARPPAEVYEEQFVPALFRPWGRAVSDAAGLSPGQRVLDVACGTGALTEAVCERVMPGGAVVGLDANPELLEVASRKNLDVAWREARAEALPFADAAFDAVVSQFGLMFFEDRAQALREMMRVLRPRGRLVVAVCDGLQRSPGYAALADLLQRLFGSRVADAFRAPFALGDPALLHDLCAQAGIGRADISSHAGTVQFESVAALVATERACAWTLGGLLDDAQFERLLYESPAVLAPFARPDGTVAFEMPALIISARRPA